MTPVLSLTQQLRTQMLCWFDSNPPPAATSAAAAPAGEHIEWLRILPFVLLHLACLAVFWVGVSYVAVAVMVLMYLVRMFAITGFYHRYFFHRAFKTLRGAQWFFAVLGASAAQRGPLWWAAHHRHHHAYSDQVQDLHSPVHRHFVSATWAGF